MTIAVAIIPCYNEEKYITDVVNKTRKYMPVVVIDNRSTDRTAAEALNAGASVVRCDTPGMGAAVRSGINYSLNKWPNQVRAVVTLDGDGQHNPDDIPGIVGPVIIGHCDMVIGVRASKCMPAYRSVGNRIIAVAQNLGSSKHIIDAQCGLRAFSHDAAIDVLSTTENGFGWITETTIKMRKHGRDIVSVPVSCTYHSNLKDNSTANPIAHGLTVLSHTLRWRLWEFTGV